MYVPGISSYLTRGRIFLPVQQYCQLFCTPKNRHCYDAQSIKVKLYTKKIMNKNLKYFLQLTVSCWSLLVWPSL